MRFRGAVSSVLQCVLVGAFVQACGASEGGTDAAAVDVSGADVVLADRPVTDVAAVDAGADAGTDVGAPLPDVPATTDAPDDTATTLPDVTAPTDVPVDAGVVTPDVPAPTDVPADTGIVTPDVPAPTDVPGDTGVVTPDVPVTMDVPRDTGVVTPDVPVTMDVPRDTGVVTPDVPADVPQDVATPVDVPPVDVPSVDVIPACAAGETRCASGCVDLMTHVANCGACGAACATGRSCVGGVCQALPVPYTCHPIDGSTWAPIVAMAGNVATRTLASIMAAFPNANMRPTPGLSVAVREADGTVHTAVFGNAFNTAYDASAPPLSPSTLFQAGSISKPISTLAYLMSDFADATRDVDIRPAIATLLVPPYAVSPSDLLSHISGASVHGFTGYAPGLPLPTLDQIVLGRSPANNLAVTFSSRGAWLYSGGGIILWQDWLERRIHEPMPTMVHDLLFAPASATRSRYTQPLPATEHDAACGSDPILLPGICRNVYPESAAAGLWTTPADLACIAGYATTERNALTRVVSRTVPISGYPQVQGLGFRHRPANGVDETAGHFYEHGGVDYGFCSQLAFFSDGRAIVVMDNACAGDTGLVVTVTRTLCVNLGWTCSGVNLAAH